MESTTQTPRPFGTYQPHWMLDNPQYVPDRLRQDWNLVNAMEVSQKIKDRYPGASMDWNAPPEEKPPSFDEVVVPDGINTDEATEFCRQAARDLPLYQNHPDYLEDVHAITETEKVEDIVAAERDDAKPRRTYDIRKTATNLEKMGYPDHADELYDLADELQIRLNRAVRDSALEEIDDKDQRARFMNIWRKHWNSSTIEIEYTDADVLLLEHLIQRAKDDGLIFEPLQEILDVIEPNLSMVRVDPS